MKKGYTDITVVLDRSGSMSSIKTDTEGGFNRFIEDQKKLPGLIKLSLYQFDDKYEPVYVERSIFEADGLVLHPRGWTALYDAVGKAIVQTGERLAAKPESERPDKVVVVIITDGMENSSKEYGIAAVKDLIKQQQGVYSWQFVFLGADITAMQQAADFGIPASNAAFYAATSKGVGNTYRSLSANIASFHASSDTSTLAFSDEEREKMKDANA